MTGVTPRAKAKVEMVPPNYDGLPLLVLLQRIAEIDAAIVTLMKHTAPNDDVSWEHDLNGKVYPDQKDALLAELDADKARYIDALSKTAKRSKYFLPAS